MKYLNNVIDVHSYCNIGLKLVWHWIFSQVQKQIMQQVPSDLSFQNTYEEFVREHQKLIANGNQRINLLANGQFTKLRCRIN